MISKIGSTIISFVIGMGVAAYILSHTEVGFKFYSAIADLPTIQTEDVKGLIDKTATAIDKTGKIIDIGTDLYSKYKR